MPVPARLLAVLAVLALVALAGWWWRRRDGRLRPRGETFGRAQLHALGLDPTGAGTLALLLGTPTCAPCRTVRAVLGEVAAERDGFAWTYLDATEHLDLARRHRVLRVPTLFVCDADGTVLARASGVPDKHELLAVVDRRAGLASVA